MGLSRVPKLKEAVVIDDKEDDAFPLIRALWKLGISCRYFSGKVNELPAQPVSGVRLVFLDLVLDETAASTNPDDKVSKVINVLLKVIGSDDSFYLAMLWTANSNSDLPYKLKQKLEETGITKSFSFETLNKADFRDGDKYDENRLNKEIRKRISKLKQTKLLLEWEDIVDKARANTINTFLEGWYQNNDQDQLSDLLFRLSEAYTKVDNSSNKKKAVNALLAFNSIFTDTLENDIRTKDFWGVSQIKKSNSNKDSIQKRATINRKLILFNYQNTELYPGNVYESKGKLRRTIGYKNLFEKSYPPKSVKHISLEISPYCDYEQKKIKLSRILPGILFTVYNDTKILKLKSCYAYIYTTPIIEIGGAISRLVFDFRYMYAIDPKELRDMKPMFMLRNNIVTDIQSRLASHINRPGITSIDIEDRELKNI